jgi:hypothetical protein
MLSTWTADNKTAEIKWNTGWTTKISKSGQKFIKSAYKGDELVPVNTSPAKKIR